MVSSITCIYCTKQYYRFSKSQDQSLTTQFHVFTKENVLFSPLENRRMPRFFQVLKLKNRDNSDQIGTVGRYGYTSIYDTLSINGSGQLKEVTIP